MRIVLHLPPFAFQVMPPPPPPPTALWNMVTLTLTCSLVVVVPGVAGTAAAWSRDNTFSEWQRRPCLCLCRFAVALPATSVASGSGGGGMGGVPGQGSKCQAHGGGKQFEQCALYCTFRNLHSKSCPPPPPPAALWNMVTLTLTIADSLNTAAMQDGGEDELMPKCVCFVPATRGHDFLVCLRASVGDGVLGTKLQDTCQK